MVSHEHEREDETPAPKNLGIEKSAQCSCSFQRRIHPCAKNCRRLEATTLTDDTTLQYSSFRRATNQSIMRTLNVVDDCGLIPDQGGEDDVQIRESNKIALTSPVCAQEPRPQPLGGLEHSHLSLASRRVRFQRESFFGIADFGHFRITWSPACRPCTLTTLYLNGVQNATIHNVSIANRRRNTVRHGLVDLSAFNADGISGAGRDITIFPRGHCDAGRLHRHQGQLHGQ